MTQKTAAFVAGSLEGALHIPPVDRAAGICGK